jgi:hypothetical protein
LRGPFSYRAFKEPLDDAAVALGLVFGAVAEDRNGAVLGEALEAAEKLKWDGGISLKAGVG